MPELKIDVTIDGREYTQEQLARYEYERTLHMLHEMKVLGAEIRDNGKVLSHEDLNWLDPEDAKRISVDLRYELGEKGILTLFHDVLADSDRRQKEYNKVPIEEQGYQTCSVDYVVTGITLKDRLALSRIEADDRRGRLAVFPEHYLALGSVNVEARGMENFGMLGEPTYIKGSAVADIPDCLPIKREPDYPICQCGETRLASDDTPIRLGAVHQYKPAKDGFLLKLSLKSRSRKPDTAIYHKRLI